MTSAERSKGIECPHSLILRNRRHGKSRQDRPGTLRRITSTVQCALAATASETLPSNSLSIPRHP